MAPGVGNSVCVRTVVPEERAAEPGGGAHQRRGGQSDPEVGIQVAEVVRHRLQVQAEEQAHA